MRLTITALAVVAGLAGFGTTAQAAAVPTSSPIVASSADVPAINVQMTRGERRMMRHRVMRHRMMRHRVMRHRMMHRRMMHRM